MEALSLALAGSWLSCIAAASATSALYPTVLVPLTNTLQKRKRSINKYSSTQKTIPPDYWLVVLQSILVLTCMLTLLFRFMATSPHVRWNSDHMTLINTAGAFVTSVFVREFINYFVHRLEHSRLFYKLVHERHHRMTPCHGLYDGLYSSPIDVVHSIVIIFIPIVILPSIHVLSAMSYIVIMGYLGFVVNHCGREMRLVVWLPRGWSCVLYDNQPHDDHHTYRRGNYADVLPVLDRIFGTEIVVSNRGELPAQKRWRSLRQEGIPKVVPMTGTRRWLSVLASLLEQHPDSCMDEAQEDACDEKRN